jgi:hypothetical protein
MEGSPDLKLIPSQVRDCWMVVLSSYSGVSVAFERAFRNSTDFL